jgi:hypothetical protein
MFPWLHLAKSVPQLCVLTDLCLYFW